jgi:hypothetical protein
VLTEKPLPVVSPDDIERAAKRIADLREDLRRCMNRIEANRNAGHLLDNTVRESFRLSQAITKALARLQALKARRAEALKPVETPLLAGAVEGNGQ